MNWTSFWTGVAVTVVGGLILFVIIGGPRWFLAWRKKGALEADRAHTERTPIRVGGHIVAEEIRANANIGLRCEEGHHVPSEARRLTALPGQLQPRINAGILFVAGLIGLSFAVGLIVGRWWAVAFPAAVAVGLGLAGDFEGANWQIALPFGIVAAVAATVGVLIRRFFAKPS